VGVGNVEVAEVELLLFGVPSRVLVRVDASRARASPTPPSVLEPSLRVLVVLTM
jgi:hypothetical protein